MWQRFPGQDRECLMETAILMALPLVRSRGVHLPDYTVTERRYIWLRYPREATGPLP